MWRGDAPAPPFGAPGVTPGRHVSPGALMRSTGIPVLPSAGHTPIFIPMNRMLPFAVAVSAVLWAAPAVAHAQWAASPAPAPQNGTQFTTTGADGQPADPATLMQQAAGASQQSPNGQQSDVAPAPRIVRIRVDSSAARRNAESGFTKQNKAKVDPKKKPAKRPDAAGDDNADLRWETESLVDHDTDRPAAALDAPVLIPVSLTR